MGAVIKQVKLETHHIGKCAITTYLGSLYFDHKNIKKTGLVFKNCCISYSFRFTSIGLGNGTLYILILLIENEY